LLAIWFRPGDAVEQVVAAKAWVSVLGLAGLSGAAIAGLAVLELAPAADLPYVMFVLPTAFVEGAALLLVTAFFYWLFGRMLGGSATPWQTYTALAWAAVPWIVGLVLSIAIAASPIPGGAGTTAIVVILVVSGLWTFAATVAAVRRVQRVATGVAVISIGLAALAASTLVAVVIRITVLQSFSLPSSSMAPTLRAGDYFFVDKSAYGYSHFSLPFSPPLFSGRILAAEPRRGDVAVFRLPRQPRVDYIKRIVGLPGDRIQMRAGVLVINDVPVKRERVEDDVGDAGAGIAGPVRRWRITLPGGVSYFALDLQDNGALDNTQVYVVPPAHYFVIGDNLDNSTDSRVPADSGGVGYVPFENLIGRAVFVYFSIGHGGVIRSERIGQVIR